MDRCCAWIALARACLGGHAVWAIGVVWVVLASGCASKQIEKRVERRSSLHTAYCTAMVSGVGIVDVETEYIPSVVNCENGAAGFEALKAQAVAARSYLYYRLDRDGSIGDGQHEQVFGCSRMPSMLAYMAADATSGEILVYRGAQVAGFYVAGAKQRPPTCKGNTRDPTGTEPYVTYNAGKQGSRVRQTSLGYVHPQNLANRGAKSQNGAACLDEQGWRYDDILRFYYGEDIDIVKAEGPCITPLAPRGSHGEHPARGAAKGAPSLRSWAWLAGMAGVGLLLVARGRGKRRGAARRASSGRRGKRRRAR